MHTSAFCNCESLSRIWIAEATKIKKNTSTYFPVQRQCFYISLFPFLLSPIVNSFQLNTYYYYYCYEFGSIAFLYSMRYSVWLCVAVCTNAHDFILWIRNVLHRFALNATSFHNFCITLFFFLLARSLARNLVHTFNRDSLFVLFDCMRTNNFWKYANNT